MNNRFFFYLCNCLEAQVKAHMNVLTHNEPKEVDLVIFFSHFIFFPLKSLDNLRFPLIHVIIIWVKYMLHLVSQSYDN